MSGRRRSKQGGARGVALDALQAIEEDDAYLQAAIDAASRSAQLDPRDRGLALELTMGVTRWRARLDYTLNQLLQRGLSRTRPELLRILRLAIYQVLFLDRIPDRAAVHTAVDLARSVGGQGGSRFVNGVLRSFLRQGESLPEGNELEALAIRWSHPDWMIEDLLNQGGYEWAEAVCLANNTPAPLTVRSDQSDLSRASLQATLVAEGATVTETSHGPDGLHLSGHPKPFGSESFRQGLWTVQDEASQLIVRLLDPQPGESIWDVCAAPGGKTRYIDHLVGGEAELLATDLNPVRVENMRAVLAETRIQVDVHDGRTMRKDASFDRVLVDAPCSALGVIRRHPEIRWRRMPRDIEELASLQAEILSQSAKAVKPGGSLVYSVCTHTEEEGPAQIRRFLEERTDYRLESPPAGDVDWSSFTRDEQIRLMPHLHGTDGFYAVRLRRQETS